MFALLSAEFPHGTNKTQKKSFEFVVQLYLLLKSWRQNKEHANLRNNENCHVHALRARQKITNHQVQNLKNPGTKNNAPALSDLTKRMTKRHNRLLQPVFMHPSFVEPPKKTTTSKKPDLALSELTKGLTRRNLNEI